MNPATLTDSIFGAVADPALFDRLGIVPLFWTRTPADELVFASEVKAFADAGLLPDPSDTPSAER